MSGLVRIGISGWRYPPWRGVFYPEGLRQKDELAYASRAVDSIEVNGSFYSLMHATAVERWCSEVARDFVFAVKGSRFITHMKRLGDVRGALANFFAAGVLAFGRHLGPILWQLPPSMSFDAARLESFFAMLPRTTREAAKLARKHDDRVTDPRTRIDEDRPIRYAIEPRSTTFRDRAFYAMLRAHDVSLCIADTAGVHPNFDEMTASFVYVRLHGDEKLYESGYSPRSLARWATRIERWKRKGDVYVYFDNDARVRAPFDARALRALVRGERMEKLPRGLSAAGEPARTTWPAWRQARRPA